MKRKQRTSPSEQLLVDQTMEALDHCDPNTTKTSTLRNGDQRRTTALGNQLRNAIEVDLPPANPGLREMLIEELDSKSKLPKEKTSKDSSNSSVARWAIAAMVLLAAGIWVTIQFSGKVDNQSTLTLKYQDLNGFLEPASNSDVEGFDDGSSGNVASSPREQTTIKLPMLNNSDIQDESTVLSVPDGGTVFLGGIKSMEEQGPSRTTQELVAGYLDASRNENQPLEPFANGKFTTGTTIVRADSGGGGGFGGGGRGGQQGEGQPFSAGQTFSANVASGYGVPGDGNTFKSRVQRRQKFQAINNYPDSTEELGNKGFAERFGQYYKKQAVYRREFKDHVWYEIPSNQRFESSNEQYERIPENQFVAAIGEAAISTFSIDVDTAAYANLRRFINSGQMPPAAAVRIEEMVNYFSYDYPQPKGNDPFSVNMELASCPWNPEHKLLRVGLKGKDVHRDERPQTNVVFLIDVSGSMTSADKLPLLKRGFQMMVDKLTENDRVSIVTYAGNAGGVLEPTSGDQKKRINEAIESLTPGGSTHGSAGIELAYKLAQKHFIREGVNKVILATDGDLNVGVTSDDALVKLITEKASEGVFLTVLGFGTGNLKDAKMEKLADNGNGMYAYIDSIREAHKVLVDQMSGSLVTIAKDVKIQIEFNPAEVRGYRLIGYENRMLATEDFDNDKKDAGEIGAGHTVTALYELVTTDQNNAFTGSSKTELKYQNSNDQAPAKQQPVSKLTKAAKSGELLTLALRYKEPDANKSKRIEFTLKNDEKSFSSASSGFRFAASVASFGLLLRGSEFAGQSNPAMIEEIASAAIGEDASGYRAEFVDLVRRAGELCR